MFPQTSSCWVDESYCNWSFATSFASSTRRFASFYPPWSTPKRLRCILTTDTNAGNVVTHPALKIQPSALSSFRQNRSHVLNLWRAVFTFIHCIADISNWTAHISNSIEYVSNSIADISKSIQWINVKMARAVFTFIHWNADICNWIWDIFNWIGVLYPNTAYLEISPIELEISPIELQISSIELEISPNRQYLEISPIHIFIADLTHF